MPLRLPAHVVELLDEPVLRAPPQLRASDPHALRKRERRRLMELEEGRQRPMGTVERVVPLVDSRWAVGRRSGQTVVWRVVPRSDLRLLDHPAWLWVSDDWLDPHQASTDTFPTPARLGLHSLMAQAGGLHASGRHVIKALAACVRSLRAGQPTALVVSSDALNDASHPARAFALALLTILPPSWRAPQRISVGDPSPRPGQWTLVITNEPAEGYLRIDVDAPDDEGTDIVAFYVRERLLADDPEALEATAIHTPDHTTGPFSDPWADAVAAVLKDPPAGVAAIDDGALETDAEGAVRALTARIAAGTSLDADTGQGTLAERLLTITRRTRDPRPWIALAGTPAAQRARAVLSLLDDPPRAHGPLIDALVDAYPPGADLGPWLETLLRWLAEGTHTETIVGAVEHTLLQWPVARSSDTRASVWSEVVSGLVALGEDEAAMDALLGAVARQMVSDSAGSALAALWTIVPEPFRDPDRLDALVRLLASGPDADGAIVTLFQHTRGHGEEVARMFRAWHDLRAQESNSADALFEAVRDTPWQRSWLDGLFAARDPVHAADAIAEVTSGPDDPLWLEAERAMSQALRMGPAQRFFTLPALARGVDALEPLAPLWLIDALPRPFPSPEITDVARVLLTARDPSPLWSLVAVASAAVERFDDEVIDAAVVDFCSAETLPVDAREAALSVVEQLGAADGFDPLDHARWIVRISLAPDGSRITPELSLALVRGILGQADGLERLLGITLELLALPPEHPALLAFVHFLLPRAFDDGVPAHFRDAVPTDAVPAPLRSAWDHACRSTPPC